MQLKGFCPPDLETNPVKYSVVVQPLSGLLDAQADSIALLCGRLDHFTANMVGLSEPVSASKENAHGWNIHAAEFVPEQRVPSLPDFSMRRYVFKASVCAESSLRSLEHMRQFTESLAKGVFPWCIS